MKFFKTTPVAIFIAFFSLILIFHPQTYGVVPGKTPVVAKPVNPEASPEAKKLLARLYQLRGKVTLSGMHNVLGRMSKYSDSIKTMTGKYPNIWGGDFGFADSTHDIDNIKYRSRLVNEIKKQYARGSIIVMTYHEANPVIGEPCAFEGGVISKLTDQQWKDLLTPGTDIYNKWKKQMDLFAGYLQQLKDAHIPVIFRPYHEMNGDWFWWGGRKGPDGFIALYKQVFSYFTKEKHLNNILWAWTPDKPTAGVDDFYSGSGYVDILGCDIYPKNDGRELYPQEFFDRMTKIAAGKPVALTECSQLPTVQDLKTQPWLWFMSWGGMVFESNKPEQVRSFYHSGKVGGI